MKNIKIQSPEMHLTTLMGVYDPVEAELVRNTLKDHGIACSLEGEHQAGFTGTLQIGVLVREGDVDAAKKVIQIHHPHLI